MPEILKSMDNEQISRLGASLRRINQRILAQKDSSIHKVWFQGGEPYFDLFIGLKDDNIEWFQMTLRGKSISWNKCRYGWQTGETNELNSDDNSMYSACKFIEEHKKLDLEFVELTKSILQARAGEEIFDRIIAIFNENT